MKFDKDPVTLVTAVTPCRGVYPRENIDILENLNEGKEERHTLLQTVTCVTSVTKFLKCPECNFKNIYPETVEHHIKYKHGQDDRQGAN